MNLEQLKRKPESTRREWWNTLNAIEDECDSMTYERNKYLDASIAIAKLKLVAVFIDNDETVPQDNSFTDEELGLLREFEEYIIYDRMSPQDIIDYIKGGSDDKGIVQLAKHAALQNYQQINSVLAEKNIPGDLALAFQTIYQERLRKMQMAAARYMEESGGLLETKDLIKSTEQERAKLRGTGTTRSPVAATMWERTHVGEDEEGTILATKWTEVTERVEDILGFRCDQFRQVIVLPQ